MLTFRIGRKKSWAGRLCWCRM